LNPPDLRFQTMTALPAPLTNGASSATGWISKSREQAGRARAGFRPRRTGEDRQVSKWSLETRPAADNDLKDTMEKAAVDAMDQSVFRGLCLLHEVGVRSAVKDKYFKFASRQRNP